MTAAMLRAVEPARDTVLDRLPDPARVVLPSLELLGRRADETVDRLRGRSRRPAWGRWLIGAAAIGGIVLVVASVALTWTRSSRGEPDGDDALGLDLGSAADPRVTRAARTGLTAAESSLLSYDPVEGRDD